MDFSFAQTMLLVTVRQEESLKYRERMYFLRMDSLEIFLQGTVHTL